MDLTTIIGIAIAASTTANPSGGDDNKLLSYETPKQKITLQSVLTDETKILDIDRSSRGDLLITYGKKEKEADLYLFKEGEQEGHNITANNDLADFNADFSPDGSRIIYASTHKIGKKKQTDIWEINIDTDMTNQITNNEHRQFDPSFNHDGTQIAFVQENGSRKIMLKDLLTENEVTIAQDEEFDLENPAFNNDGTKIAFVTDKGYEGGGVLSYFDLFADSLFVVREDANAYFHKPTFGGEKIYTIETSVEGATQKMVLIDPTETNIRKQRREVYRTAYEAVTPISIDSSGNYVCYIGQKRINGNRSYEIVFADIEAKKGKVVKIPRLSSKLATDQKFCLGNLASITTDGSEAIVGLGAYKKKDFKVQNPFFK